MGMGMGMGMGGDGDGDIIFMALWRSAMVMAIKQVSIPSFVSVKSYNNRCISFRCFVKNNLKRTARPNHYSFDPL